MDFDNRREWRATVSERWFRANNPGHSVSIGFVLGEDISDRQIRALSRHGKVKEVVYTGDIPKPW